MSNLKISVVTVVKNDARGFEKTAQSVLAQDCRELEWIVIDGGSTDRTVEAIRKHENRISYWCTESDLGHYDAMNKGLSKAIGEWSHPYFPHLSLSFSRNMRAYRKSVIGRPSSLVRDPGRCLGLVGLAPSGR